MGLKVQTLDVDHEPTSQDYDCLVCFSLRHGLLQTEEAGLAVTRLISNSDLHTKTTRQLVTLKSLSKLFHVSSNVLQLKVRRRHSVGLN
jgi:hypothetical protein